MNDLKVVLLPVNQGLVNSGVDIYQGSLNFGDFTTHFQREELAETLDEKEKCQRDVTKSRKVGVENYLLNRKDIILPAVTLIVSNININSSTAIGSQSVIDATIPALASRFISDGQGRHSGIEAALKKKPDLLEMQIPFKLVVTNSDDLKSQREREIIRQIFHDYHEGLKKPSSSQSAYFNGCSTVSDFINRLLSHEIYKDEEIGARVALQGIIRYGQFWTYTQFRDLLMKMHAVTLSELETALKDPETVNMLHQATLPALTKILSAVPSEFKNCSTNKDWITAHKNAIYSKAIFCKAIGLVVMSIIEDAEITGTLNFDVLDKLVELPLGDMHDPWFLEVGVTENKTGSTKIVRGSETALARAICNKLRVIAGRGL